MIPQKIRKYKDTQKTVITNGEVSFKKTTYRFNTVSDNTGKFRINIFKNDKRIDTIKDVAFGSVNKRYSELIRTYNMRMRLDWAQKQIEEKE